MEQIFYFQVSKEVYVCLSRAQANKGGEVTHFVIQIRYTASIVPAWGLFSSYTRATKKFKSFKISYKCK
jgi:hypothetical protein